jgi:hypothetical protein
MLRGTAGSQYPPSKPAPTATSTASPYRGGVAFTGADVSVGAVLAFGLVVVGAVFLLVGRRRGTSVR